MNTQNAHRLTIALVTIALVIVSIGYYYQCRELTQQAATHNATEAQWRADMVRQDAEIKQLKSTVATQQAIIARCTALLNEQEKRNHSIQKSRQPESGQITIQLPPAR